jgi:hypothetical protein
VISVSGAAAEGVTVRASRAINGSLREEDESHTRFWFKGTRFSRISALLALLFLCPTYFHGL